MFGVKEGVFFVFLFPISLFFSFSSFHLPGEFQLSPCILDILHDDTGFVCYLKMDPKPV